MTPEITAMASALQVRVDGVSAPIMHEGREVFPALAHFSIIDPASHATVASLAILLPDLTAEFLRQRVAEKTAQFAPSAILSNVGSNN